MFRIFTLLAAALLLLGQLNIASSAAQGDGFALTSTLEQGGERVHKCCDGAIPSMDAEDCASECVHAILGDIALLLPRSLAETKTPSVRAMRPFQEWPNGPPPILSRI
ncbi:hypothetical protein [Maritalea mediterranea]|uniref:Uncharacterized protein n=1 Tax=Maritalea mediterranea TaxID=2909667 RepID=A0ABS9E3D2_9HYPH|nr:hypothetical protein [Maritalea mediterranea]MCF4097370.1 hypothetical protein [Maritalea mediterranea]